MENTYVDSLSPVTFDYDRTRHWPNRSFLRLLGHTTQISTSKRLRRGEWITGCLRRGRRRSRGRARGRRRHGSWSCREVSLMTNRRGYDGWEVRSRRSLRLYNGWTRLTIVIDDSTFDFANVLHFGSQSFVLFQSLLFVNEIALGVIEECGKEIWVSLYRMTSERGGERGGNGG